MNAIPQVLKEFLGSEKAVAAGLLVVAATVFVLTGKISFADWQTYTTNLLGIYVAGKTIQGTAAVFAARKPDGGVIIAQPGSGDVTVNNPPTADTGIIVGGPKDDGVIVGKDSK